MTSKKKIESNRKNAKKSTGPKTRTGKTNSRKNATKHGLLASTLSETLIMSGGDRKALSQIIDGLHESYKPATVLEEMLIDIAVTKYWRLQKVLELENSRREKAIGMRKFGLLGDFDPKMRYSTWGEVPSSHFSAISAAANSICQELKKTGQIRKGSFEILSNFVNQVESSFESIGDNPIPFENQLKKTLGSVKGFPPSDILKETVFDIPKKEVKNLTKIFKDLRDEMKAAAELIFEKEMLETMVSVREAGVEFHEETGLQIRYETSLENGFFKALHELQRVQAFRMGKKAPIPEAVDINLSKGDD